MDSLLVLKMALEAKVKRQEAALEATRAQLSAVVAVIAKTPAK